MPLRMVLLMIVLVTVAILVARPMATPAQEKQSRAYYLRVDGGMDPPHVLFSTLSPPPAVERKSSGNYTLTFSVKYDFLVGTSEGVHFGHGQLRSTLLMATQDRTEHNQWHIQTVEMTRKAGSEAPAAYFRGRDTVFNLVIYGQAMRSESGVEFEAK
jgi:hypothetical protein